METANDTAAAETRWSDSISERNISARASRGEGPMAIADSQDASIERKTKAESPLLESATVNDVNHWQHLDQIHSQETDVTSPVSPAEIGYPFTERPYQPLDAASPVQNESQEADLPNPYDYATDGGVSHYAPTYTDSPLHTPDHEAMAPPRRLPSVLRPGNPKSFDTPGSRRASMALLGDFEFGFPRPSYAMSEADIRRSYAGDTDSQYEALFKSWEEPVTVSSPWNLGDYNASSEQMPSETENFDVGSHPDCQSQTEKETIPARKPSTGAKSMRMPEGAWPEKKSRGKKLSKWKFWSKKSKSPAKNAA